MESPELKSLLQQYLAGTISEEDFRRLWETLNKPASEADWLAAIEEAINTKAPSGFSDAHQAKQALEKIKEKIYGEQHPPSRVYFLLRNGKRMIRYAAAVVVIISAAILIKYSSNNSESITEPVAVVNTIHDVEPGGQKAILTLSDGSKIVLDNANSGQIAQQGHMQVIKTGDGEIQYKSSAGKKGNEKIVAFNTMSTPRGGHYQLLLPDGSKAWLNAESSITYPVAFAPGERKVKITGEAYFEIAKDKSKPFRVVTSDQVVEVLGTHFNVNAYPSEEAKTSLLEGSVKISPAGEDGQTKSDRGWILKPGQAFMNGRIVRTDVDQDVAWKNGIFNFNNQNLSQVMRQLARWYDLQIVYPGGIPQKEYGGEIGRNLKLNQVLKGLENSGVHFELNGKQVTVTIKK
jgi:transmembrane sensor